MGFSQALSGLNSAAAKLDVVGNNIANSQTVGFKSSGAQFADVYAGSVGLGTRVSAVLQNFKDGNIESTNRNLDLAIAGQGFYRFQQGGGEVIYSRNGQLSLNADGDLINAQGAKLMGYGLEDANDPFSAVAAGGEPVALNVPSDDMPANATQNLDIKLNLDSGEPVIAAAFDPDDSTTYSYSTSASVFDSQGNARNLTLFYTKTAANTWEVNARLSGGPAGAPEYTPAAALTGLTFDANGVLSGYTPETLSFDLTGEGFAQLDIAFDQTGSTQFANTSTVNDLDQDGYTSGTLVGITIQEDGTVMRNYSNEQSVAAGQIVLANFRNPEGLSPEGDNGWSSTQASGQELLGTPGSGVLGAIQSGAIETSNVDMARELVEMIVTQRAYQANSQTIKTQDEVLQTAINLR